MRISPLAFSFLAAGGLLGCLGSQRGQLYDLQAGRVSNVVAMNPRAAGGVIEGSLPNGNPCKGSFTEVSNETARQLNVTDLPLSENAEVTMAVLDCGDHQVLECALTRRPFYGFSFGACKDHHGEEYSLLFEPCRATWRSTLLCCTVLVLGCAAEQKGWVSPLSAGDRATVVLDAAFARRGSAEAMLPNGERCAGSFNTVAGQVTYNDERPTIIDSEDSQLGLLMLTCPRERIIRCEFSRGSAGTGYGKCKDGAGQLYSLALSNSGAAAMFQTPNEIPKAQASR